MRFELTTPAGLSRPISNLRKRARLIRSMQASGVVSLLGSVPN